MATQGDTDLKARCQPIMQAYEDAEKHLHEVLSPLLMEMLEQLEPVMYPDGGEEPAPEVKAAAATKTEKARVAYCDRAEKLNSLLEMTEGDKEAALHCLTQEELDSLAEGLESAQKFCKEAEGSFTD